MTRYAVSTFFFLALWTHVLGAQESDVPTFHLKITPAAEPRPALRHRMQPEELDRRPGNAAPYYYRAILKLHQFPSSHWDTYKDRHTQWLDGLPGDAERAEMRAWLAAYDAVFADLHTAAHREFCDWDLRFRDLQGLDTVSFHLHEFQELRTLARALQVRIRLAIGEQRFADALASLQLGYQLAEHTTRSPILINSLIGLAVATMMNGEVQTLIGAPDSPNLYWAVAMLPPDLPRIQEALEFEIDLAWRMFPFLREAADAQHGEEQWRTLIYGALDDLDRATGESTPQDQPHWLRQLNQLGTVIRGYSIARQGLLDQGYTATQLRDMPVGQAIAVYTDRELRIVADEMQKWTLVGFPVSDTRLRQVVQRLSEDGFGEQELSSREALPMAILMPSVAAVNSARFRLHRERAFLMNLEAIRLFASEHGRLPRTLNEIEAVPVPSDVTNGKPFPYQLDGDAATLEMPERSSMPRFHRRCRLELRR